MKGSYAKCRVERTKRIRSYSVTITGRRVSRVKHETRTEPCGAPLFGAVESATGVCASCACGWTHRGNKPTPAGRKLIETTVREVFQDMEVQPCR